MENKAFKKLDWNLKHCCDVASNMFLKKISKKKYEEISSIDFEYASFHEVEDDDKSLYKRSIDCNKIWRRWFYYLQIKICSCNRFRKAFRNKVRIVVHVGSTIEPSKKV